MEPGRNIVDLRIDRLARLDIRVAIALFEEQLAVLDHRHHRATDIAVLERVRHEAIEPDLKIGPLQRMRTGRRIGGDRRTAVVG